MDSFLKRTELAGRRALVRLFRLVRPRRRGSVQLPLDAAGKRILMLRQDRIGDVLVSLPIIHALKKKFPTAKIDALFGENNYFVAPHDAAFDERFVYRKEPLKIFSIIRALRKRRYDFVIDFMDNVSASSTLLVPAIGARCAVGIEKENGYAYDVVVPRLPQASVHIVDRLAELLRPFGIVPVTQDLRLSYDPSVSWDSFAANWLNVNAAQPRIGINLSASSPSKEWGADKTAAFIQRVKSMHGNLSFVLFCAPGEEQRAAQISKSTGVPVYPPGSFDAFAAGIKHCNALVTVDTSAVHLAAAFQVPAVVLYVHDNPALMPWTPYHSPFRAVMTTAHTVENISVDEVVSAFIELDRECGISAATPATTA